MHLLIHQAPKLQVSGEYIRSTVSINNLDCLATLENKSTPNALYVSLSCICSFVATVT